MPIETAGMLVFAFPEHQAPISNNRTNRHYKHPASIWARETKANMEWLTLHGLAQCEEYTRRYKRRHKAQDTIEWVDDNLNYLSFDNEELTPFARCFSDYKDILDKNFPNTLEAYREFYWLDKKDFAKWPDMDRIPHWWKEKSPKYVDKSFVNGIYTKR